MGDVRVSQELIETLTLPTPDVRVTQVVIETVASTGAAPVTERVELFLWLPV
jgi:hypothetical protein